MARGPSNLDESLAMLDGNRLLALRARLSMMRSHFEGTEP